MKVHLPIGCLPRRGLGWGHLSVGLGFDDYDGMVRLGFDVRPVTLHLSPDDARRYAQEIVDMADRAEGLA